MITYLILNTAKKLLVNGYLLLSICTFESNLRNTSNYNDPNGGSHGICMLQLSTARDIYPWVDSLALFQPELNIKIAAIYLKQKEKQYNNIPKEISAYNAGHAVSYNIDYVNNVLEEYKKYDNN